jgi:hypothetical protein
VLSRMPLVALLPLFLWISTPAAAGIQTRDSRVIQRHPTGSHDRFGSACYRRQPLCLAHAELLLQKHHRVKVHRPGAFLNPYGALPNPFTAKPNPYGAWPNPFAAKPNPYGAWPNPFTVKPNPYGMWPNPFTGKPNPYGAEIGAGDWCQCLVERPRLPEIGASVLLKGRDATPGAPVVGRLAGKGDSQDGHFVVKPVPVEEGGARIAGTEPRD